MPDVEWTKPSASINVDFLTGIHLGGWKQLVRSPTRLRTILDVVFTLNIASGFATVDQEFPGSDHRVVLCSLELPNITGKQSGNQMRPNDLTSTQHHGTTFTWPSHRPFKAANWKTFEVLIRQVNWDEFFLADEVNIAVNCFLQHALHCMYIVSSTDAKLAEYRSRSNSVARRTAVKVKKLKSLYRKTADFSAVLRLVKYNITVMENKRLNSIREEKRALDNPQQTAALSLLLKRRNPKRNNSITYITGLDGTVTEDPKTISETFNTYFASVYTTNAYPYSTPTVNQLTNDSLSRISVELKVIKSLVAKIRPSLMPGPDGLPPIVICNGGPDIPLFLLNMYNLSLNSGVFPCQWKKSIIIPRHKGGPLGELKNYRPINHTPIVSRTLERIVKNSLSKYLEKNQLISASQHGFMSRRSCMTCQMDFLNKVTSEADSGKAIIIILLDMEKAFDRVPHIALLTKLHSVGICDPLLSWFASFLQDRTQVVRINDSYSTPKAVTSGVVQGSVLGPLLFLIYINSICDFISHGHSFLFADDIKLVYSFCPSKLNETLRNIQADLDSLTQWSNTSMIKFSPTKSNVLTYKCIIPYGSTLIAGEPITTQNSVRDLGIRYSSSLNFSEQVSFQLAKARQAYGFIKKSFTLPRARLVLYKSNVRPLLEYCPIICSNMRKQDRLALESFQRAVTKSIVGYSSNLTYRERCQQLSIEALWLRRLKLNINFLHGLIYKHAFTTSDNDSICLQQNNGYYLRNKCDTLRVPPARTNLRARFFLVKYSSIWNMLPSYLRGISSRILFRKRLHDFLNHSRILEMFQASLTDDGLFENGLDNI
jgi:hypothetical protein